MMPQSGPVVARGTPSPFRRVGALIIALRPAGSCSVVLALFGEGRLCHSALCSCSFFGSKSFLRPAALELHAAGGSAWILERPDHRDRALYRAAQQALPSRAAVPGAAELRVQLSGVPTASSVGGPEVPRAGSLPALPGAGAGLGGGGGDRHRELRRAGGADRAVGLGRESGRTRPCKPWRSLGTTRARSA